MEQGSSTTVTVSMEAEFRNRIHIIEEKLDRILTILDPEKDGFCVVQGIGEDGKLIFASMSYIEQIKKDREKKASEISIL